MRYPHACKPLRPNASAPSAGLPAPVTTTWLVSCWLLAASAQVSADPATRPVSPSINRLPPSAVVPESPINGSVDVAFVPCKPGGEFPPAWTKKLTFVEAPESICLQWKDKGPSDHAVWQLLKAGNESSSTPIASGVLTKAQQAEPVVYLEIPVRPSLGQFNTSGGDKLYRVEMQSTRPGSAATKNAYGAQLVHQARPGPVDPYACSTGPTRKLVLEIPKMTVNHTSSTAGDGDGVDGGRDELYVSVGRTGPGAQSDQKRLPSADDYYEAHQGHTYDADAAIAALQMWSNKNQTAVAHPILWSGNLKHGDSLMLGVTAMEQDNSDLHDIRAGFEAAFKLVGMGAGPAGAAGKAVADIANAAASVSGLIPDTSHHDAVGIVAVQATNLCGNVQIGWVTFKSADTPEGKVSNSFSVPNVLKDIPSRLAVLTPPPLAGTVATQQVDWSPYEKVGRKDELFWEARGTSSTHYTFLLRARIEP